MIKKEFKVSGMCCPNCVTHIQTSLGKVENVENILVQFEEPQVTVHLKNEISDAVLINAIQVAGHYEVIL